jgi:asparagine synthase (glutamine-hydrolysing)
VDDTFARHFDRVKNRPDPLDQMLYVDTKTWLVDDLLTKADKMTMAASVELRVPFLDHRLVELAASLRPSLKVKGKEGKWILKKAMEGRLPDEVIWRQKMGFPVPTKRWFGAQLLSEISGELLNGNRFPWINSASTAGILGKNHYTDEDHSRWIMTLLVFKAWRRRYKV